MAAKYDLNDDRVVVIIGSGAGGGTLGNELAQKGVDVVILEAGARPPRVSCTRERVFKVGDNIFCTRPHATRGSIFL